MPFELSEAQAGSTSARKPFQALPRWPRLFRFRSWLWLASWVAVLGLTAVGVDRHLRDRAMADAAVDSARMVRTLAQETQLAMRALDMTLQDMRDRWQNDPARFDEHVQRRRTQLSTQMPFSISIVDSDNRTRFGHDVAAYLPSEQQAGDIDALTFSLPVNDAARGGTLLHVARPLRAADGMAAGRIVIAVPAAYFTALGTGMDPGSRSVFVVARADGYLLARVPALPPPERAVRYATTVLAMAGQQVYIESHVAKTDGVERLYAWTRVPGFPLLVCVGRSHADVFVSYQRQRELLLGACIALVVVGALALWWRSVAVRQREAARRALERSEVRLQFALEGAREVVWDWDMTTGAAYFSPRLVDITGQDQSDLPGRMADWAALIHPDDLRTVREAVRAHVQGKAERYACEYRVRGADGAWRWVSARGTAATRDGRGRTTRLTGVLSDITETRLAQDAEQSYRLRYDPLTGLINRGALLLEGTRLLSQNAAAPCWLLCIDLDRFTVLNDGLGHEAGNVVLQLVARRIQEVIGHDATVARMEANQFVVLLETAPHQDVVARTVHDLRKEIASPLTIGGEQYVQTCSIGIASSPADGQVIGELLSRARAAMRRAKGMGGNHAQFYTEALNERTVERLNLEKALRLALVNGELSLQFQPQVEMASSRIVGAEALLRWQHPELGMVPPDRFIPIAEETGMIGEIGQWVLRQACACARQWRDAGYVGIRVSVNLSGYQFRDVDLVEQIAEILHETGLPSALLDLEITESVVIDDLPAALRTMWRLKLMGITLSLDDFGTGYSSLSYLRQLPIDTLKIDRSFIGHVASDTRVAAITTAILTMARDLGLATVAEGVELATQIEFLQQRHCDLVQGYYFSRPIAHALFMQRLATEGQILPAGAPG